MKASERNALVATGGLALIVLGALLPWARVGGRNRSGLHTADTFISLADGALPDTIAWVGRWWYLPAVLALLAWATTFAHGHWATRAAGLTCAAVGLVMWWLFVWAGEHWNVLDIEVTGPLVASVGMAVIAAACARRRASLLRPRIENPRRRVPASGSQAPGGE